MPLLETRRSYGLRALKLTLPTTGLHRTGHSRTVGLAGKTQTKDGQEVTSPRPSAPQAKFRVLDLARANEIAKAKRDYGFVAFNARLVVCGCAVVTRSRTGVSFAAPR